MPLCCLSENLKVKMKTILKHATSSKENKSLYLWKKCTDIYIAIICLRFSLPCAINFWNLECTLKKWFKMDLFMVNRYWSEDQNEKTDQTIENDLL